MTTSLRDSLFTGAIWRHKRDRTRRIRIEAGLPGLTGHLWESCTQPGGLARCGRFSVTRNTSRRTQSIGIETLYKNYRPMLAETRLWL